MTDRGWRLLAWALATYAAWVGATYLLEGLPRTLQRPETEGLRVLYAVLANLLVGVGGSGLVLARVFEQHALPTAAAGVNSPHRTIVMVCAGLAAGAAVYELQSPPSRTVAVLVNGFAQVLPVSAAEVLVCCAPWRVARSRDRPHAVSTIWCELSAAQARKAGPPQADKSPGSARVAAGRHGSKTGTEDTKGLAT